MGWTTRAFFVVFVLIMPIIIMNLLVGLAVDDIKTVQENAILKRLAMQVQLQKATNSVSGIWLFHNKTNISFQCRLS